MPAVGFEPTISAGERLQTYALDRAATGTGYTISVGYYIIFALTVVITKITNRMHCID